jgi:hypothetical protein
MIEVRVFDLDRFSVKITRIVWGATTLNIMTLGTTTFSITIHSKMGLFATLSIYDSQDNNTAIMPSVVILNIAFNSLLF